MCTGWTRSRWSRRTSRGARGDGRGDPRAEAEATDFGVVQAAPDGHRIEAFVEKPADPPGMPGQPGHEALASMGNYVFDTDVLVEALRKDAADDGQPAQHGRRHHPEAGPGGRRARLRLPAEQGARGRPGATRGYWREVGTIDSYFDAHMDLCAVQPVFNLYNDRWPILTHVPPQPPAKFVQTTATGWDGRSTAWSATASSSPAAWCATRCCRRAPGWTAGRGWSVR